MKNKAFSPKQFLLLALLLLGIQAHSQQQEKQIIGVYPFANDGTPGCFQKANHYWSLVSDAINNTGRFTMVDRSKWNVTDSELSRQKDEAFLKSDFIVEQGLKYGASYVLQGMVQYVKAEDGSDYHQILLQLIDVQSQREIDQVTITPNGNICKGCPFDYTEGLPVYLRTNPEKAVEKNIRAFIANNFPLEVPIVEVQGTNKDGHTSKVLVECGEGSGMKKDVKLFVLERSERTLRDGSKEKVSSFVAELEVEEVQGKSFSVCAVTKKHAPKLTEKMNAKANLIVTDKDPNAK